MKISKFTVVLAVLLISILAIGAVSAESVDDSDIVAVSDGDVGDIQESIDDTGAVDDLSSANTADETVGDDSGAVLGDTTSSYDLDDDSYSTYFNEDGTATEVINESSDYTLNIGTLNNKDIIITYGSNINIVGKDGAGVINNGTITIGDGIDTYPGSITISGLTFTNTNKDAICVNQFSTDITIDSNKFDLIYDSDYAGSPMAITTYGYVDEVKITNNNIKMVSAAAYTYGIDLYDWLPDGNQAKANAEHFYIANNEINITSTYVPTPTYTGVAEGMYLDSIINSVIENNTVYTYSTEAVANYGITLADSYGYMLMYCVSYGLPYTAGGYSPYNVTIKDNNINIESDDMAYGITVISWWDTDEYYDEIIKDMVISNNNVTIDSKKGAIGIGVQTSNVKVTDNDVSINANPFEPVKCYPDPVFGNESYAISVDNSNQNFGMYYDTTVKNNIITTNVPAIFVDRTKGNGFYEVEPLVIEGNVVNYTGPVEYTLDDDHYFLFFNDDGTPTDLLNPEGNYTLYIDTLTNKDINILTGNNIYIGAKEGAGIINNGSITIGNDIDELNLIFINGLTFNNFNKNGITLLQNVKDSSISQNTFNLTYDDTIVWPAPSPAAITVLGYADDIRILGNNIDLTSDSMYAYGITFAAYGKSGYGPKNAEHILISGNVMNIVYNAAGGMAEAIYLDTIANSAILNNKITVITNNAGAANYGIQLADSADYAVNLVSPYNVTIEENSLVLNSVDMVYGITVISTVPSENSKDLVITNNDVNIVSDTGAIGIGAVSSDVSIKDNAITLTADPTKEVSLYAIDRFFGNTSYGIFVNNNNEFGTFNNTTVTGNNIATNVESIKVAEEEADAVKPLVIEDNEAHASHLIDDDSYATYFNTDGTIKDDAPISAGDVLLLGDLTGKKFVIDLPLTINGVPNKKQVNTSIKVISGADGTVIDGLNIEYPGLKYGAITLEEVNNVEITNNKIIVPSTTQTVYGIAINDGENGCNNISINNNFINITGSKYVYGIDIWQDYSRENKHNNIMIFENEFFVTGTGGKMTEAIFVSNCNDIIIDGNNITAGCDGPAYGIGTNYIFGSVITNNHITVGSDKMAYGITATTSGSDLIVRANDIDVVGVGAVGIGINNQTGATIEDNTIAIDGGDYTSITVSDSLGTANAAILVGEGNTNVEMSGNDVTETSAVRLDTAIEVSDMTVTAAPSGEGKLEITLKTVSGMLLANQTVKVVFDNKVYELTTDAKGVAVLPFALNKSGTFNVDVFYLGDDNYRGSDATAKLTINKINTAITASGKTFLATATTKSLTATLKDAKGNVLANKKVTFSVNGKTYTATTNAKGVATVKLALKAAKTYTVSIKFAGDSVYAASTKSVKVKLNKEKTKITAPKKTFKRTAKTKKVVITLKNSKGKAIAKKKVTLIVNKKKYTVKTNKKGKATFKVKLTKKGTFKYTVKFAGDTQYKAVTKKTGKIKIK